MNYPSGQCRKANKRPPLTDPVQEADQLVGLLDTRRIRFDDVRIAAHLGYEPALLALGLEASSFNSLIDFYQFFRDFSKELWIRIAVSAARAILPIWVKSCPGDTAPGHTVEAAERWILTHSSQARAESDRLRKATDQSFIKTRSAGTPVFVAKAIAMLGKAVAGSENNGSYAASFETVKAAAGCLAFPDAADSSAVFAADRPSEAAISDIIEVIKKEVVPWVLRYYDPVADRQSI